MRILFIENRQQTRFWEAVAARLKEAGHEIFWLVQNPAFRPAVGTVRVMPFPSASQHCRSVHDYASIAAGDRTILYFGGTDTHYEHYDRLVRQGLAEFAPDVVIGEPTLFHERLVIRACRETGLPYFYPGSTRYPPGRFAFFRDDTLEVFAGSGEQLCTEDCHQLVDQIAGRTMKPDYVQKRPRPSVRRLLRRLVNDAVILSAYVRGEKFNTPGPIRKVVLQRRLRRMRELWEAGAVHDFDASLDAASFVLLYPMQLQPEANLDVWGAEHRDQLELLRALVQVVPPEVQIVVKPNPNSKYELTEGLIQFLRTTPRVVTLSHHVPMAPIFRRADLILTVTGTVAIEAVLSGKPVVTLARTPLNALRSCVHVDSIERVPSFVRDVMDGKFPRLSLDEKCGYLQRVVATSYRGVISNPYSAPSVVSEDNVDRVSRAFEHALGLLAAKKS